MKIDGRITILVDKDGAKFQIEDSEAGVRFLEFTMKPEDFCAALGRLGCIPCSLEVGNLKRVGKVMEMDKIEFCIPDVDYGERKAIAYKIAKKVSPEGWEPDNYFGAQGSFFYKDGKHWARTHIRRWVEKVG